MRFVKFDAIDSKVPVYINRAMVRVIRAANADDENSVLTFDKEHHISVVGASGDTVRKLED